MKALNVIQFLAIRALLAIVFTVVGTTLWETTVPSMQAVDGGIGVKAYVPYFGERHALSVQYSAKSGLVAPVGCHYELQTEEVIHAICELQSGSNTYFFAGDPGLGLISAHLVVGKLFWHADWQPPQANIR